MTLEFESNSKPKLEGCPQSTWPTSLLWCFCFKPLQAETSAPSSHPTTGIWTNNLCKASPPRTCHCFALQFFPGVAFGRNPCFFSQQGSEGEGVLMKLASIVAEFGKLPKAIHDSQSDRLRLVRWMTNRLWGGWKCDLWCSHANEVMLSRHGADVNFWAAKLSGFCVTRFGSF